MLRKNTLKKGLLQKNRVQNREIIMSLWIMIFFIVIFISLFYRNNRYNVQVVLEKKDINVRENKENIHSNYSNNIDSTLESLKDDDFISIFEDNMSSNDIKLENIINVPYLNQTIEFPTGCEVTSATMLLNFYGYDYSIDNVIDEFLPISEIIFDDEEGMIADSPYNSFVGNPRSSEGFGCFAPVIATTLKNAIKDQHRVIDISGMDLDKISQLFLNNGIPVLVWETIDMVPSYPSEEWKLLNSGEIFTWTAEEHCMVLVGYDEDGYYFNDPLNYYFPVEYDKELAKERFEELNRQAVVIIPSEIYQGNSSKI